MSIFGQDTRRHRNGTLFLAGREVVRDSSADSSHILQCFALDVGGHDGVCAACGRPRLCKGFQFG
jgi:hypothetical protein